MKRTARRRLEWVALSAGFVFGVSAAAVLRIAAAPGGTPVIGQHAALNVLSHSHGCEKVHGSTGTLQVFANGIKNAHAVNTLRLACALTSPPDGFDTSLDFAGIDVNDQSTTDGVLVSSCFTARAVSGTGCTPALSTSKPGVGLYGMEVAFQTALTDSLAVRYLDVTLPPTNAVTGVASVLRSFGYFDHSAANGGGGGGGGDLTALQATVDGHTTSINSLNTTVNGHTTAIADLETEVASLLGGVDLSALQATVSGHTTSINNANSAISGHTTQLSMHTVQLNALETSASSDASQLATLSADVAAAESSILTLQTDMFNVSSTVLSHESTVNQHTSQLSGAAGSGLKTIQDEHTSQLAGSQGSGLKTLINEHTDQLAGTLGSGLMTTIDGHTGQLAGTLGSGLKTTIDGHTSQLAGTLGSGLKTTIDGHTGQLSSQASQLSSHAGQLSTLNGQMSGGTASGLKTALESADAAQRQRLTQLEGTVLYRAFVTSTTHTPVSLGGLSGADTVCQMRADSANLGGTWWAWLSSSSWDPDFGFSHDEIMLLNVKGEQIAKGWSDYTDGTLIRGINFDENGVDRSGSLAWTGTAPNGIATANTCGNFAASAGSGTVGAVGSTGAAWTDNGSPQSCATAQRLYCFQVYF